MIMAAPTTLRVVKEGAIERLVLDRPERGNALTVTMAEELNAYFGVLPYRDEVRVVVLTGAGRHFCVGLDLDEHGNPHAIGPAALVTYMRRFSEVSVRMRRCPQPVIAALRGAVCGGGLSYALAADMRVAAKSLRIAPSFLKVGVTGAELGLSYLLPRLIGASAAAELMLTGRELDADEARALGLVARVVADDALDAAVAEIAQRMLAASPLGLRLTKDAITTGLMAASLEAAIEIECRSQALAFESGAFAEGLAAFAEKRAPDFSRRD